MTQQATSPHTAAPSVAISRAAWGRVLSRTAREIATNRISLSAAGCAFYATLALFPAISMLVSIYGLIFGPATIGPQLAVLHDLLPPSAFQLIADRVRMLVAKPAGTLTFSLVVSFLIALWSSATGTKSILGALDLAYGQQEQRGFLHFQLAALGMTLGGIVAAVLGLSGVLLLPTVLHYLGLRAHVALIVREASEAVLMLFVLLAVSLLYRFGPQRRAPSWHWLTPGSVVATVLWVAASELLSSYVRHLAGYDATYGPMGAVVGVMMWFYVSAFAVLVGAELNVGLEKEASANRRHD